MLRSLAKGVPSVIRLPSRFRNMIVLEETISMRGKKYANAAYTKAPYTLVEDFSAKDILSTLNGQEEIELNDEFDLYTILAQPGLAMNLDMDNLPAIEEVLKRSFNFYIVRRNDREARTLYHRLYTSEHTNYDPIHVVIRSRNPLSDGSHIEAVSYTHLTLPTKA